MEVLKYLTISSSTYFPTYKFIFFVFFNPINHNTLSPKLIEKISIVNINITLISRLKATKIHKARYIDKIIILI